MKYWDLRKKIKTNIFSFLDVSKAFPNEAPRTVRTQLSRFSKKRLITGIKRGCYCFEPKEIDQLELSANLYRPSYISLETALNYYALIPDIPQSVTAISLTTTKKIKTDFGIFNYTKIKSSLFFGFTKIESSSGLYFNIAKKEKALLDYFYIRRVKNADFLRLDLREFNKDTYALYSKNFPAWVQKIISHIKILPRKRPILNSDSKVYSTNSLLAEIKARN